MAKRAFDWEKIRAEYEAGATQSELSRRHGVSRTAIQKHIESEGWTQDAEPAIQRKVSEKVAGLVAGCNPIKKAEAIDAEAERRAAVVIGHRQEWEDLQGLQRDARGNFDKAKLFKINAEATALKQAGERKAWGLDPKESPRGQEPQPDDLRKLTDEELDERIAQGQNRVDRAAAELDAIGRGKAAAPSEG